MIRKNVSDYPRESRGEQRPTAWKTSFDGLLLEADAGTRTPDPFITRAWAWGGFARLTKQGRLQ
jgi:hypothetical protein